MPRVKRTGCVLRRWSLRTTITTMPKARSSSLGGRRRPCSGVVPRHFRKGLFDLGADAPALEAVFFAGPFEGLHRARVSQGWVRCDGRSRVPSEPTLICWPDGTLSDYIASLERLRRIVRTRRIRVLLTAHGLPIDDPLGLIDRQTAHRLSRLDRVRKIVAAGAGFDVDRILETVYDDVDARLNPAARVNVQAQIAYLQEEAASSTRI